MCNVLNGGVALSGEFGDHNTGLSYVAWTFHKHNKKKNVCNY